MEAAELRKQVNQLWKQAVDQLEEVKEVLSGRLEEDMVRLRQERDRLLRVLGEQTYRLANQGKLPLPAIIKRTVDRLNEVIDGIVNAQKTVRRPVPRKKAGGARKRKTKAAKTH